MILLVRRLLFAAWLYGMTFGLGVLWLPSFLFQRRAMRAGMRLHARVIAFGMRWIMGVRLVVRGREHAPAGPALVAGKHQSMLDTIAPFLFLDDPCFVLKAELARLPVYGWIAWKSRMIPVDREAGASALRGLMSAAKDRLADERQLIIFPEGTRTAPGASPDYKPGVAALYRELGLPCLPMATNSGACWPASGIGWRPGVIVYELLPAIPPGLKRGAFMSELQERLEGASDALVQEA